MSVYTQTYHPAFRRLHLNLRKYRAQARCMLDTFKQGQLRENDAHIIFITNSHMRRLTAEHLLHPHTTDVLSFRLCEQVPPSNHQSLAAPWHAAFNPVSISKSKPFTGMEEITPITEIGSVYIAPDYCARMARRKALSTHHYITVATVHGLAHLAGYDHQTDEQYEQMKEAEQQALNAIKHLSPISTTTSLLSFVEGQPEKKSVMPSSYLP